MADNSLLQILSAIEGLGLLGLGYVTWRSNKKAADLNNKLYGQELELIKTKEDGELRIIAGSVFDKLGKFDSFLKIRNAVDGLLDETKADRFLILVAINKIRDFNDVTVIYEQHGERAKGNNAILTYNHIEIDDHYREMLKRAELYGPVNLDVAAMQPCLLKDIYEIEGVRHSKVTHLHRESIDSENDAVFYSSIATHQDEPFDSLEVTKIRLAYQSQIVPVFKKMFELYE